MQHWEAGVEDIFFDSDYDSRLRQNPFFDSDSPQKPWTPDYDYATLAVTEDHRVKIVMPLFDCNIVILNVKKTYSATCSLGT